MESKGFSLDYWAIEERTGIVPNLILFNFSVKILLFKLFILPIVLPN